MIERGPKVRATAASANFMDANSYVTKKAGKGATVVVPSKKTKKGVPDTSYDKMNLNTYITSKKATKVVPVT